VAVVLLCVGALLPAPCHAFFIPQHTGNVGAAGCVARCGVATEGPAWRQRVGFFGSQRRRGHAAFGLTRACTASTVTAEQPGDERPEPMIRSEELLNAILHGDPAAAMQPLLDATLVNLEARKAVGMEGDIVSKIRCEVFNQDRGLFRAQRRKMRDCPTYLLAGIYHTTFLVAVARATTLDGQARVPASPCLEPQFPP
jgi:hypothetical protein